MSDKTLWDRLADFDAAQTSEERERIREEIRAAGFPRVAETIGMNGASSTQKR